MALFNIGSFIKQRREKLGITRSELAEGLYSLPTFLRIENGSHISHGNFFAWYSLKNATVISASPHHCIQITFFKGRIHILRSIWSLLRSDAFLLSTLKHKPPAQRKSQGGMKRESLYKKQMTSGNKYDIIQTLPLRWCLFAYFVLRRRCGGHELAA